MSRLIGGSRKLSLNSSRAAVLNLLMIPILPPLRNEDELGWAWLKHGAEEAGNSESFLPAPHRNFTM